MRHCCGLPCAAKLRGLLLHTLLIVPLAVLLPAKVAAQDPDNRARDLAGALARIAPGSVVRVQTGAGDVLQGALRLTGDSVVLEGGADRTAVALGDVRSAWYQQRRTRTGAVTGALIGASTGGAFMGLLALVASANERETATVLAVGILGGGAAGGLLGGVVGAAVPRWVLAYPVVAQQGMHVPAVTAAADADVGRRRLGALEASLGYGRVGGDEPTGGGPGGRVALHAELGADPTQATGTTAFWAIGPELSWFDLGSTDRIRRARVSADSIEFTRGIHALAAGGVLRGGVATGVARTYGVLGLAYHRWEIDEREVQPIGDGPEPPVFVSGDSRFEHLGYMVGAGLQASVRPFTAVGLELRRTSVGTFDMDLPGSYWSVTLSGSRRW